jgi:hypothetical protein
MQIRNAQHKGVTASRQRKKERGRNDGSGKRGEASHKIMRREEREASNSDLRDEERSD